MQRGADAVGGRQGGCRLFDQAEAACTEGLGTGAAFGLDQVDTGRHQIHRQLLLLIHRQHVGHGHAQHHLGQQGPGLARELQHLSRSKDPALGVEGVEIADLHHRRTGFHRCHKLLGLHVSDAANKSPASFALQASLTSRTTTATEIGYVILNDGESTTVVDDFTAFKARAKTLFSSLESDDIVIESTMQFEREFLLRNGQNIRFFSISDATLDDLSGLDDSRLSFFNSSIDNLTGQASFSNANGVTFDVSLLEGDQNLSALIAQEQTIAPLLDFTAFTNNETVSGSIVQSREADYDAITGFHRVLDTSGSVRAADGSLLRPGDAGYAAAALRDANQIATFSDLSVADGQSSSTDFSLQDSGTFAPFAQVNGHTFFAFDDANPDGLSHFRSFGTNLFGLEDQHGGGDFDYDDHIVGFNITELS